MPQSLRIPVPLLRQVDRVVIVFQGDDLDELLGEPIFTQPADLGSQAAELQPLADDLRQTLTQVDEAQRQVDEAKVDKDDEMRSYDVVYPRNVRSFEDSCRMVGDDELADRVRPVERRPGRPKKEESSAESEDQGAEAQPAEAQPAEVQPAEDGDQPAEAARRGSPRRGRVQYGWAPGGGLATVAPREPAPSAGFSAYKDIELRQ